MNQKKTTVVIGAGLSGLLAAYQLKNAGHEFEIFEKTGDVGGMVNTSYEGGHIFERGFIGGLELSTFFNTLVTDLGIEDKVVYANNNIYRKLIYRNEKLHDMPATPLSFKKSSLFSARTKLKLYFERLVPRSKNGYNLSVHDFVTRRLSEEVLDYYFDPSVAESYAGDVNKLSIKSAYPRLYSLEEKYGSLFLGLTKSAEEIKSGKNERLGKMFTFSDGMQSFAKSIASYLGKSINFTCDVYSIVKGENKPYKIIYNNGGTHKQLECDAVICTTPAYVTSKIISSLDEKLAKKLDSVEYVPILVTMPVFQKQSIKSDLNAYGILAPSKENLPFLSAIFNSSLFSNHSETSETVSFNVMAGGAHNMGITDVNPEEVVDEIVQSLMKILRINSFPIIKPYKVWQKGIPQYNIGHHQVCNAIDTFEEEHKGILLTGNYRNGFTVGETIKNSEPETKKIITFLNA